MAIDDKAPEQEMHPEGAPAAPSQGSRFTIVLMILAALVVAQIYTLGRLSSVKSSLEAEQANTRKELTAQFNEQLSGRLSALERSNTQGLESLKQELDAASHRMGSTRKELVRARSMVAKLQQQQQDQAEMLKQEIALKADQQQLGALTQDVSATKSDLDKTKKTVDVLTSDLGMARSEMGTLIARNHQDIEYLRKLGERDYYEFTLTRNKPEKIAGVGLIFKKANVKRHRFNLDLIADDMQIEKKNRTVNEPVFFYVSGSKRAYELVVNQVQSDKVVGYLSTPKGAVETASR